MSKSTFKKLVSWLCIVLMVVTLLPPVVMDKAEAANVDNSSFNTKIADLQSKFVHGKYWNEYNGTVERTGDKKCPGYSYTDNKACTERNTTGGYCGYTGSGAKQAGCTCLCGYYSYNGGKWYQCVGWAYKMGYSVFGSHPPTWESHKTANKIRPGDILTGNLSPIISGATRHTIFIIAVENNGVVKFADCNSTGVCQVNWKGTTTITAIESALKLTSTSSVEGRYDTYILHASNNTTTSGYSGVTVTPAPSITYETISTGEYFLKNNSTGLFLNVTNGKDADATNIHTYDFGGWVSQIYNVTTTSTSKAYKLRPSCSTSRLVNPYSDTPTNGTNVNLYKDVNNNTQWWYFQKVSNGYVIRLAYNTNLVLADVSGDAKLQTYSGAANQVWQLIPRNYTVSYNANGGSGAPGNQNKIYQTALTLSSTVPTRTGYTFKGWSTSSSGSVNYAAGASYTANAAVTLYAVWQANTYTVSYNANGGSGAPGNQTKTYGSNLTLSSTIPTRTGYTFKGWSTSASGSVNYAAGASYTANAAVTLYAVWQANTYTVSYNANGGSGAPGNQTKTYGSNLTLSSTIPTRTGYTFKGWSTSATGSVNYTAGAAYSANAAVTLYAVWEVKAYTIFFEGNGGSNLPSSVTRTYGQNVTFPATVPVRPGYTFNGWIWVGNGHIVGATTTHTSGTYMPGDVAKNNVDPNNVCYIADDCTYVATWSVDEYTVSYDANGGTGAPSNQKKTYGTDLKLSSAIPTRDGYTFQGWASSKDSSTVAYVAGGTYSGNSNITLYAVWETNVTYQISYDACGGQEAPENQIKKKGENVVISLSTPTRAGYTFVGWSASNSSNNVDYNPGDAYTVDESIYLYAVWSHPAHKGEWVVSESATCTKKGLEVFECIYCDYVDTREIDIIEHIVVEDKAVEATCSSAGLTEGSHCLVCGEIIVAQNDIEKKAHKQVIDNDVEATCTEAGLTQGTHCSVCGETIIEQIVIPAKGHKEVIDKGQPATCTKLGYTESSHCSVCGEVLVESIIIPASGHASCIDEYVAPTCTEVGHTEGSHCLTCGETLIAQKDIAALGHKYDTTVIPATYTEPGYTVFVCRLCGDVYTDMFTNPIKLSVSLDCSECDLATNDSIKLTATVSPSTESQNVTWASSDEKIATVDKNGLVTALSYGKVTITATAADGSFAECVIQTRFSDVNGTNDNTDKGNYQYYYDPVYWAADKGITAGYTTGEYAGKFGVGLECTREDFATFLYRLAGAPATYSNGKTIKGSDIDSIFADSSMLGNTSVKKKAIAWAYSEGIIKGYTSGELAGKFGIGVSIDRRSAMIMIWRYAGKPTAVKLSGTKAFTDVVGKYKESSDSYKAIAWAAENGITGGLTKAQAAAAGLKTPCFGCDVSCTREQMITFLYRYNNLK